MHTTPNYSFNKNIEVCALDAVDRELRRLEDKVDCCKHPDSYTKCETDRLLDGKVDKKDGCRLICEGELRGITDALDDRYTKGETYSRDELYTQEEVDALLAEKADAGTPELHELVTEDGYETWRDHRSFYFKSTDNIVHLNFSVFKTDNTKFEYGEVFARLPEGFRPIRNAHRLVLTDSYPSTGIRTAGAVRIDVYGNITFIATALNDETPAYAILGEATFLAEK